MPAAIRILNVLPGQYDLKVTVPGFRQIARTDIEIAVNTVTRENVQLEVGQATEQVTVSASAVQLQTDKSDVRHELTASTIQNLPLPAYRNYQSLLALVPARRRLRSRTRWSIRPAARCVRSSTARPQTTTT